MGPGFLLPFGVGGKRSVPGGRRLGAKRPERGGPGAFWSRAPLFCLAGRGAALRAAPRPPNAAAPRDRPIHSAPPGDRRTADGCLLARGEQDTAGVPAGAAAFCGPGGPAKPKQERGPRAPAPALCALCAPAAPPETLEFLASHTIHPPTFSAPKPAHKTSGPLPMSGPPAYSIGNQQKYSSWFSPAFFKSGREAEPSAASGGRSEAEAQ